METKYRAWDKRGQRMWWNVQNAYDGLGNHQSPDPSQVSERLDDWFAPKSFGEVLADSNYVVMQYTGLKDKNGKEIYEGDIVCHVEDVIAETIGGYHRYEPESKFTEVKIPEIFNAIRIEELPPANELEIIGNIYEHPHLLK